MKAGRLLAKVAARLGLADRLLGPDRGPPVILMYHGVVADEGGVAARGDHKHVGEDRFRAQLALMRAHRRILPLNALLRELFAGRDCRGLVALTFDDGYLNNFECAARVLGECGLTATFFLATGFIGARRWAWTDRLEVIVASAETTALAAEARRAGIEVEGAAALMRERLVRRIKLDMKMTDWRRAEEVVAETGRRLGVPEAEPYGQYRFMDWAQARRLHELGHEVGAHTINHAILSRVAPAVAEAEIVGSLDAVRQHVGDCASTFCYPNGRAEDYSPAVMEICRRHFAAALSAVPGTARAVDRYELRRMGVDHHTTLQALAQRLLGAV